MGDGYAKQGNASIGLRMAVHWEKYLSVVITMIAAGIRMAIA